MWPELEPEVAITLDDSLNCTVFIPISFHPILISRPERWCQVCWWLIDWLIHWSVEWLWIDFSSILTRHSAQDAEDSDSSVELDTVDYRNEAWSLGLMIIACICMHYRPFFIQMFQIFRWTGFATVSWSFSEHCLGMPARQANLRVSGTLGCTRSQPRRHGNCTLCAAEFQTIQPRHTWPHSIPWQAFIFDEICDPALGLYHNKHTKKNWHPSVRMNRKRPKKYLKRVLVLDGFGPLWRGKLEGIAGVGTNMWGDFKENLCFASGSCLSLWKLQKHWDCRRQCGLICLDIQDAFQCCVCVMSKFYSIDFCMALLHRFVFPPITTRWPHFQQWCHGIVLGDWPRLVSIPASQTQVSMRNWRKWRKKANDNSVKRCHKQRLACVFISSNLKP